MSVIKGPADASHFRVQVGRFGDRFYTDPLPASKHWELSDATHPSISTVKKASGQDWSYVSIGRVADAEPDRLRQIAGLDRGERYDALNSLNKRGLGRAGDRGTNVHSYAEALLRGTTPPLMAEGMPGWEYLPAVDDFFATYGPKLYAAEYVTIHRTLNGVGYGGTPDAIVDIGGDLYGIDWKTRTETGNHGAYPEEGAQIAAGAFADYMIVEGANGPERQPIPQLAGGLIISIKPDGCKVYPIDLAAAWNHWSSLHAWWVARRTETLSIGKPWAPRKRNADTKPERITPLHPVTVTVAPDEGPDVDVTATRAAYGALTQEGRVWIGTLWDQARKGGCDFHLKDHPTARRARITDGLVDLATGDACDADAVKALCRLVTDDEALVWPTVPAGVAVGSLGATQAAAFVVACALFIAGRYAWDFTTHPARLVEVAA